MRRVLFVALLVASALPAEPRLVSARKVWDRAPHSAFTDLIRFQDRWLLTFREAEGHVGGDGAFRLLASDDGEAWSPLALLAEEGVDLRDPKLSITPDGRLMLLAGGSIYREGRYVSRRPRVYFSSDAVNWSAGREILAEGDWLWRVTWRDGRAYGVSYRGGGGTSGERGCALYAGADGVRYERIVEWDVPGCSEVTLRFAPDGRMWALVRREADDNQAWIGVSNAPYREWEWKPAGRHVGGPDFVFLSDGSVWAAGRVYGEGNRTAAGPLDETGWRSAVFPPSGGDTSYPRLVEHGGLLWMSYYSSHEGRTSIYLAKIAWK